MTALPSQHVQPLVSGPYRLGSVTPAVTNMSISVVPVCPHLHPTNHHVQANVPP